MNASTCSPRRMRRNYSALYRADHRLDIPAAVVPIRQPDTSRRVMASRIINVSLGSAKLCCDEPIDSDRIWLAFNSERPMTVEADILWTDLASPGPVEILYGVRYTRMISRTEFRRLVDSLWEQEDNSSMLFTSVRSRESLFSLFRGHSPRGARR